MDDDANANANSDEEGKAREGADLGKDKELIGRGGDDTVDAAGRLWMGGSKGQGGGGRHRAAAASSLAPTDFHFSLTRRIGKRRNIKRGMTTAARRTAAEVAAGRGERSRGEV